MQASRRPGFTGSALIRLLARLADTDVRDVGQGFAGRLSDWIGWADAISLAAALDRGAASPRSDAHSPASSDDSECVRTRSALTNAIVAGLASGIDKDAPIDFAPYRRHCLAMQQAMAARIEPLRDRLRARLAARSSDMARLASVDAVMQQVLGAHEHRLLANVPTLLEKHFVRLRESGASAAWPDAFRKDFQDVLLAELDLRFEPLEGLLQALRKETTCIP